MERLQGTSRNSKGERFFDLLRGLPTVACGAKSILAGAGIRPEIDFFGQIC